MAVEIRELVIKTTIDNASGKKGAVKKDAGPQGQAAIVQECVAQVMDLLNLQKER
jgi:hypothetical protein